MVYNNISSKYILAKIYRDLGLDDSNYILDMIEWFGEALDFIGAASQLELKNEILTISDFKAPIPVNFVILNQLKLKKDDDWRLISYNPSNFFSIYDNSDNLTIRTEESFSINPNFFVFTEETGEVLVSYEAIQTDEEGFPLVPDNQYFKDALFWYCYKKMMLRGHKPKVAELNYEYADSKWRFYCTAARNQANYPDISMYQRFAEVWNGILPSNLDQLGFDSKQQKAIGMEEITADNLVTAPNQIEDIQLDGGDA